MASWRRNLPTERHPVGSLAMLVFSITASWTAYGLLSDGRSPRVLYFVGLLFLLTFGVLAVRNLILYGMRKLRRSRVSE